MFSYDLDFSIVSTLIFAAAIIHTFFTPTLYNCAEKLSRKKDRIEKGIKWKQLHFFSEVLYLLSEVEIVLGIWLIPLILSFILMEGYHEAVTYLKTRSYSYALYIAVVVIVISSRPLISCAERFLEWAAHIGGNTPGAWWWTILTLGPLLGAVIKEPAAMTISSLLLLKKFYQYQPHRAFQYATLGLLFANISICGMLTNFSSRALFIVAHEWKWNEFYMLTHFGWKALLGLLLANTLYYNVFKKEFKKGFPAKLPLIKKTENEKPTPLWITLIHIVFLTLIILTSEEAPFFIGIFLIFLGFWKATSFYQSPLELQSGIMVGFFFASLLIHGELQGWWYVPLMEGLGEFTTLITSFALSGLMDNAIVSYLSLGLTDINEIKRDLIIMGAMSAGGLTILANAANPIGHVLLRRGFHSGISLVGLFLAALPPALIFLTLFWFFS